MHREPNLLAFMENHPLGGIIQKQLLKLISDTLVRTDAHRLLSLGFLPLRHHIDDHGYLYFDQEDDYVEAGQACLAIATDSIDVCVYNIDAFSVENCTQHLDEIDRVLCLNGVVIMVGLHHLGLWRLEQLFNRRLLHDFSETADKHHLVHTYLKTAEYHIIHQRTLGYCPYSMPEGEALTQACKVLNTYGSIVLPHLGNFYVITATKPRRLFIHESVSAGSA